MKIGITCYPTYGGSGAVATELGIALAQRGHEIHFITYQQPFRLPVVPAAHLLPRGGRRPVSAVRVSAVRPRARGPHARGRAARTGSTCCTCTTPSRTRRARGSRARCSRPTRPDIKVRHDAARHRHHDRRAGSVVPRRSPSSRSRSRTGSPRCRSICATRRSRRSAARAAASRSSPTSSIPTVYDRSRYEPQLARAGRTATQGADAHLELPRR